MQTVFLRARHENKNEYVWIVAFLCLLSVPEVRVSPELVHQLKGTFHQLGYFVVWGLLETREMGFCKRQWTSVNLARISHQFSS